MLPPPSVDTVMSHLLGNSSLHLIATSIPDGIDGPAQAMQLTGLFQYGIRQVDCLICYCGVHPPLSSNGTSYTDEKRVR
jgi:hypothetical protein